MSDPLDVLRLLAALEARHGPAALAEAVRRCRLAVAHTAAEAAMPPRAGPAGTVVRFPLERRRGPRARPVPPGRKD